MSSSAPIGSNRRTTLAVVGLVLLMGWLGLGLHPLLHHAHDPVDQPCAVCVQLAANPGLPTVATELPTAVAVGPAPTDPPAGSTTPAVVASRPRAPPRATPVS